MRAEKLEHQAYDWSEELLWTSRAAVFIAFVCMLSCVPGGYGYMITICALMMLFFALNACLGLVPQGTLLIFMEFPNIFLVGLCIATVVYRWLFSLTLTWLSSWIVNVLVTLMAIFSVTILVSNVNLVHCKLHLVAFIAEREAHKSHHKTQ